MVAQTAVTSEEQVVVRAALAEVIADTAQRMLDSNTDEQLLGQTQARWVAIVKRAVRVALRESHPWLLEQLLAWQMRQLLTVQVRDEGRKHQFAAFERELSTNYGPLPAGEAEQPLPISGPTNGVYVVEVTAPTPALTDRDKVWSADD